MDTGHHNCRDYYFSPPSLINTRSVLDERKNRPSVARLPSRSSQPSPFNAPTRHASTFPFLRLPFELRQHVYSYLLPRTELVPAPGRHLLGRSAVLRTTQSKPEVAKESIIWRRGQTSLLCVNKRLFSECSEQLYGTNTFVLFVAYDSITFRFRWLLPSGLAPSRSFEFLDLIEPRYLGMIKKLVVTIDHVDSYTGMIKFNVGGKGLTHGLREQVAKLVRALKTTNPRQGLRRIDVRLLNGNDHLDAEKRSIVQGREASIRGNSDVQTVLEPLAHLIGLVEVSITGAVSEVFAQGLRKRMMNED
ncbi:hypothetical protein MBLNU459_g5303t1 [Dothideomycetes sp. NU459]